MAGAKAPIDKKAPKPVAKANLVYFRQIANINPEHRIGNTKTPTYLKIQDEILWPYLFKKPDEPPVPLNPNTTQEQLLDLQKAGKQVQWLPRTIRFIWGLQTIFVDEQEPNGRIISTQVLENYMNRDALLLVDGEIKVPSADSVRILFLNCMNQCQNQHFLAQRYGNAKPFYRLVDFGYIDREKAKLGELKDKAYRLATDARVSEMIPHAKYLGISFVIDETSEDRDMGSVRFDYKEYALQKPQHFIDTFADPKLKVRYQIQELLNQAQIVVNNGEAIWNQTSTDITNVPPDKTPVDALTDHALSEVGEDFAQALKALLINAQEDDD